MDKGFLTINELSEYLNLKRSTLYAKVEAGELPHYRIGRLIRFKREEVDRWMEGHRRESVDPSLRSIQILKRVDRLESDPDTTVKEAIDGELGKGYNPDHGRPDQIKGLGKGVEDGSI
jgi:excisionase family DNA binding protein